MRFEDIMSFILGGYILFMSVWSYLEFKIFLFSFALGCLSIFCFIMGIVNKKLFKEKENTLPHKGGIN